MFAPQIKPEPLVPANASRPYYPNCEDRVRTNRYFSQRDCDDRDMRRDTSREYENDRTSRYDQQDLRYE